MVPRLKCPVFDPSSLISDWLAYKNFLMQFENCVLGLHDKALKSLLSSHLSISVESFDTVLEVLRSEYLDKRYLVEQTFVAIDTIRPVCENDASSIREFFRRDKNLCCMS